MRAEATWSSDEQLPEIPLLGGDVTEGVVRVGDTVRRPQGPKAAVIHRLLEHLARRDDLAPRFLGVDAQGREVLSFIEGEVAGRPRPPWIADEQRLVAVARLLRRYHDAVVGFVVEPGETSLLAHAELPGLAPLPAHGTPIVAHLDITPENVVWGGHGRGATAVALIDFDMVRLAPAVDDVGNALLWWADLHSPTDRDPAMADVDPARRVALFADAYGLEQTDRDVLVARILLRRERSWHLMEHHAETLGGGWARMWDDGAGDTIRRGIGYLQSQAAAIERALGAR